MIKLDEDRSMDIAKALQSALAGSDVYETMLEAIPHPNTSQAQLRKLRRAIDEAKSIGFELGNYAGKVMVSRYVVAIDFAKKEITVKLKPESVLLFANKFEVIE